MSTFIVSKQSAQRIITGTEATQGMLLRNNKVLNASVDDKLYQLQDPSVNRYLELSDQLQDKLTLINAKMDDIINYCQAVIRWIDNYTNM